MWLIICNGCKSVSSVAILATKFCSLATHLTTVATIWPHLLNAHQMFECEMQLLSGFSTLDSCNIFMMKDNSVHSLQFNPEQRHGLEVEDFVGHS